MERLVFELESADAPGARRPPVVVGVVASGNLEVLVEPAEVVGRCHVEIATSAAGFAEKSGRPCCATSPRAGRSPASRWR